VHYSGLVKFYPVKNKDAETTARTLLKFYSSYGIFEALRCDQGADYTSTVIKQLHKWFGIPIHYSIIRRHESSGVEHINHEIRRHTSILLATEGLYGKWSEDTVLPLVEFLINNTENTDRLDALKFLVEYTDGDIILRDYSKDLSTCEPFLEYCRREDRKYLLKWSYPTVAEFTQFCKDLDSPNTCNIPWTTHKGKCYVNLAVWNTGEWYDGLRLPGQFDPLDTPYNISWPYKTFWYEAEILHPPRHKQRKPYDYKVPIFELYKQPYVFAATSSFTSGLLLR
jgi:hypothetical protein